MKKQWFEEWKEKREEAAEKLSQDYFAYGLGIGTHVPSVIQESHGEHQRMNGHDISVHSKAGSSAPRVVFLEEACTDEPIAEILKNLFDHSALRIDRNFYFARAAAGISDPTVRVFDGGEHTVAHRSSGGGTRVSVIIARAGANVYVEESFEGASAEVSDTHIILLHADTQSRIVCRSSARHTVGYHMSIVIGVVGTDASVVCEDRPNGAFALFHRYGLLVGTGASFQASALVSTTDSQNHDYFYEACHEASDTHSEIRAVGTADEESTILFRALTSAPSSVKKSVGSQTARFIMLSPHAQIDAIPALEIASDDMETSHGVSVSYFDEESLWYPRSRGLTMSQAKTLLAEGIRASV